MYILPSLFFISILSLSASTVSSVLSFCNFNVDPLSMLTFDLNDVSGFTIYLLTSVANKFNVLSVESYLVIAFPNISSICALFEWLIINGNFSL